MQVQFVARELGAYWPDLARLDEDDIARQASRFRGGVNNWIIQTYLRLKEPLAAAGLTPTIGETFLPGCINLAHRDSLNRVLAPYHRSFIVGVRADRPPLHLCKWEIVQNDLARERRCTRYLPFWPQPGLVPRDPARGTRIERIVYFGRTGAAPRWFYDADFHAALRVLGVKFELREDQWFDYSDVDLVLAYRTEAATMLRHKPASKLVNAWLAGTPALLADEPAYASLKRSALDYIAIASPADVLAAVAHLSAAPHEYAAMAENGRRRGAAYSAEATRNRWLTLLVDDVVPEARAWRLRTRAAGAGWLAQVGRLSRQKLATKWFKWRVHVESRAHADYAGAPRC
jgi:glycosyl transferase family 1